MHSRTLREFFNPSTMFPFAISLWAAFSGCVPDDEETLLEEDGLSETTQHVSYNNHDYLFVNTQVAWHQAQTFCSNYTATNNGGYHLVTIDDAAEESFLNSSEIRNGFSRWWIGYSDQGVEGSWIWSNGFSSFTNWAPGQPDNASNQDCAVDRFDGVDGWDDQNCGWLNRFICERDNISVGNKGSFTYSRSATSSATVNTHPFSIFLFAGQIFTMGTCGLDGAIASGDTWLRLRNPSGVEIASNDDTHNCGLGSNVSILIATTGTHVIHAGCFSSGSCSGTVAFNF